MHRLLTLLALSLANPSDYADVPSMQKGNGNGNGNDNGNGNGNDNGNGNGKGNGNNNGSGNGNGNNNGSGDIVDWIDNFYNWPWEWDGEWNRDWAALWDLTVAWQGNRPFDGKLVEWHHEFAKNYVPQNNVTLEEHREVISIPASEWPKRVAKLLTPDIMYAETHRSLDGCVIHEDVSSNLRTAIVSSPKYWNTSGGTVNGEITTIAYDFDNTFNADDRAWVIRAMTYLSTRIGCIEFTPRVDQVRYINFSNHDDSTCFAYFGPMSAEIPTQIGLGKGCLSTRTTMHEIIHALGFDHTHERPDSEDYVTVQWDNIQDGYSHNFGSCSTCQVPGNDYDCSNIMHYSSDEFGKYVGGTRLNTLVPVDEETCQLLTLSQKFQHYGYSFDDRVPLEEQISENDIAGIREIYCPNWTVTTTAEPTTGECTNDPAWTTYHCEQKLLEAGLEDCEGQVWWPTAGEMSEVCAGTCSEKGIRQCDPSPTSDPNESTTSSSTSSTTSSSTTPTSSSGSTTSDDVVSTSAPSATTTGSPGTVDCYSLGWATDEDCRACLPPHLGGTSYEWWPCNNDELCSPDCYSQ